MPNNELLGYQGATGDFFDDLQERYGATLQGIHIDEKLMMLANIFYSHMIGGTAEDALSILDDGNDTPEHIVSILNGLEEFDPDCQFAFCAAVLAQVQESYRLHKQFTKQLTNAGVEDLLAEEVAGVIAAGGERTDEQIALVSQAWGQVVESNPQLANRIELIMTAE
ncbi:hypothetical protein H6F88_01935 [Oculatella sp. FACHB-28]|uniref:hypothetical protein n=1 Tax=Oculatella sp. FACHB-28 TaxID=2692845 RepID=UPI0016899221|nr:hypothetical protein [Oculatella sp. FACHB-28]MBD2054794.1 hypothetical protein [Oculatella sp. FACHB-28]